MIVSFAGGVAAEKTCRVLGRFLIADIPDSLPTWRNPATGGVDH
jgi:hypothetical protein